MAGRRIYSQLSVRYSASVPADEQQFLSSTFVTLFRSSYGLTIFKYRHISKPLAATFTEPS
jgi:hypothetical protein